MWYNNYMDIFCCSSDAPLKDALFSKIKDDLASIPAKFERVLLVVPAQSTLLAEEEAFAHIGGKGFLTLNIVSGEKLRQDIVHETGGSGRVMINTIGRGMILRRAVRACEGSFRAFGGVCRDPRFIDMAGDLIVQMKQNGVAAEDLPGLAAGGLLSRKLTDMAMIAQYYRNAMAGRFTDSEDELAFVTGKLKESRQLKATRIYYYGFYSFTQREMQFLRALDEQSAGLSLAMQSGEGQQFSAPNDTIRRLRELCGSALRRVEKIDPRGAESPAAGVERPSAQLKVCSCASPFTEAQTIAAEILRLAREENVQFSDMAVLAPEAEGYAAGIKRVLESLGIPVFMDETRAIAHSASAEAVSALAALTDGSYKARDVLRLLKSGILPADEETVWGFENYVKQYHTKGKAFLRPLKYKDNDISDAQFAAYEALRAELAALLEPFASGMQGAPSVRGKAEFLETFLSEKLSMEQRLEDIAALQAEEGYADASEETRQMWGLLCDLLAQMTELLGSEELSCGEFGEILLGALAEVKVGVLPQSGGKVQIGSIKRTLLDEKKAVFIAGFCDGMMPSDPGAGGILTERELSSLSDSGKTLSKPRNVLISEEIFMIYRALACAKEQLWVGIPTADAAGEKLDPSPLLKEVRGMYPGAQDLKDAENSGDPLVFMQGRQLPLSVAASVLREGLSGGDVPAVWKAAYNILSEDAPQLKEGLLYKPDTRPLGKDKAGQLYASGGEVSLSPSRMDTFASCPFKHFINFGLSPLQPRPFGIAAIEMGNIYHEVLLKLCVRLSAPAKKAGIPMTDPASLWMTVSRGEVERQVAQIMEDIASGSGAVMTSSKAEVYRSERIRTICSRFAWHMIEQVRAGRIDSMWFETGFGRGKVFPPIVIQTAAGNVYVEGKIDRVDAMPAPDGSHYIKIVDYKSGSQKFSRDLVERGLQLQLMTYLEGAIGDSENKPAGVYYFRISADDTESAVEDIESEGLSEKVLEEISKKYRLDGLTVDEAGVLCGLDEALLSTGKSDVVSIKKNKKDGTLSGSLISAGDMEAFRAKFRKALASCAESLCMGEIRPTQKKVGKVFDSCKYCEYSCICLKDTCRQSS